MHELAKHVTNHLILAPHGLIRDSAGKTEKWTYRRVHDIGDLVAIARNERHTIPLLEDWDPVDTTGPPHCAHVGEHRPPSTTSYYPPTQVEVHTELEFFRVNDDLWQTPLTEEEEAALIAQEAADNEAAELEEFRQAHIRADI